MFFLIFLKVLKSEFEDYSRGKSYITEEDFAKILLRYTVLSEEQHEEYLNRLRKRITSGKVRQHIVYPL